MIDNTKIRINIEAINVFFLFYCTMPFIVMKLITRSASAEFILTTLFDLYGEYRSETAVEAFNFCEKNSKYLFGVKFKNQIL